VSPVTEAAQSLKVTETPKVPRTQPGLQLRQLWRGCWCCTLVPHVLWHTRALAHTCFGTHVLWHTRALAHTCCQKAADTTAYVHYTFAQHTRGNLRHACRTT
jgi:hypothetical protein